MEIRAAQADDADACVAVLAALPDYFTPSTHDDVRRELPDGPAWLAEDDGRVVGFVVAPRRFARALADLASAGVTMVEVKTLDASANYEPYVATRAFWERRGFVQIDCIDPLPGWQPGNPSAIYAQAIENREDGA